MSTIAAPSDEQASFNGVPDNGLGLMIPISQPVQAIKTEFVPPANDIEENLTPGYVELTNTTHNSLSIVANDYQFLTDASSELEPLANPVDNTQSTASTDNLQHSTSSDFQLIIPDDDHQTPASNDQQLLANDIDIKQQPPCDTDDSGNKPTTELTNCSVEQPTTEPPNSSDDQQTTEPTIDSGDQQTTEPTNDASDQPTPEPTNGSNDQPIVEPTNSSDDQPKPVDIVKNDPQPENQPTNPEPSKADPTSERPSHIPPHLMGRDLNNPAQDMVGTNRRVQKPRLGVKVPYRNLTSQIVTQDEIAQEILERQMRKYSYNDIPEGGDVLFAYKLTSRLANKISANENLEKKNVEAAKTVATTVANVTASDSSSKTDAQASTDTSLAPSAIEVSNANLQAENSNADVPAEPSDPNVQVEKSNKDVSSAVADDKTVTPAESAPAEPAVTNNVQPAQTETPQPDLKIDPSPVDELYAELSSTLKEEYDPNATPVQLFSSVQLNAHQSGAQSSLSNAMNGSMTIHGETELDNDTLLAILEGTTDVTEPVATPIPPQTAIISTPAPPIDDKKKRKKRMKPVLDPLLEKELALKQLMAFETKRKERKPKAAATPKSKAEAPSVSQNGVVATPKPDTVPTPAAASTPKVAPTDSPKRTKRAPNSYNVSSQAPKRFPKKYQRIIKQQLRSSKKLKTKNQSPDQQPQVQKRLPEVPEVQIAIDRYIKTYASKRKHKPDCHSGEKLVVKKLKTDSAASIVAPTAASSKVVTAKANVPHASTKAVVAAEKVAAAKPVTVSEKPVAASTKAVVGEKVVAAKTVDAGEKSTSGKVAAVIDAVVAASVAPTDPAQPPVEAMEVEELAATTTENEILVDVGANPEMEQQDEEAVSKSKMNTKMMREINRLLGDEGAINMIFSVEQKRRPGNRVDANAVLPSARRKKKDLQLRTKMVKDAVLRLSMSGSSQGTPTRAVRRTLPETPEAPAKSTSPSATAAALRKTSIESVESTSSELNNNSSSCAVTPRAAKVRQLAAEASRIIRRHSSSSAYSSDDDEETPRKVSADKSESASLQPEKTTPVAGVMDSESVPKSATKITVTEKKGAAKSGEHLKAKSPAGSRRASKEPPSAEPEASRVQPDVAVNGGFSSESFEHQLSLKEITVRKYDNLVQIILISSSTKMKNALSIDILRELISVLRELEKDNNCRTVLVTSTGSSFCQGIDLQTLICVDKTERTKIVNEFVSTLVSFTKCLSQFPKILIAGVHGSAVGLGVTMLPFFDMVYASDKATFYTPYVKLGQIPEAGATLTLPHLLGNAVTSELLFGCRMLTASEALQFGLVTRILWPDKFAEELLPLARGVASHSLKAMEATKLLLRQGMTAKLEEQLETEAKLLREHWSSDECQSSFKNYLDQEALLQNK